MATPASWTVARKGKRTTSRRRPTASRPFKHAECRDRQPWMVLGGEPPERAHVRELAGHDDAVLHHYEVVRLTPWRLARDALRHHGRQRSADPGCLRAPCSACSVGIGT